MKFCCSIALFVVLTASAAYGEPTTVVLGAGMNSCDAWSAARSSPKRNEYVGWLLGYVTGFNAFSPDSSAFGRDISGSMDGSALVGWMDAYCPQHPRERIMLAADELLVQLSKKR